MAGAPAVGQPLDLLMLDLKAAHVAYRNALAWHAASLEDAAVARVEETRAELGRAASALAQWCGEPVPAAPPESHGARRARIAEERLDFDRRRARELAAQLTCRVCGGTGLAGLALHRPCDACAGQGVA